MNPPQHLHVWSAADPDPGHIQDDDGRRANVGCEPRDLLGV
jgi:hypothetical protein